MPEDKTPQINAEDEPAGLGITGLAESFEKVAKSAAAAALIFLIVFGCCYKWGEDHGQDAGQQIRLQEGKHVLNALPSGEAVLFWKDDKILQGGLYGFLTVALLSTWVVLFFIFRKPPAEERAAWAAAALSFPNLMSPCVVVIILIMGLRLPSNAADATGLALSVALAICSWRWKTPSVAMQILLLVGQTLLLSFFFGENRGIASADFEKYPLVEVLDTGGHVTDCLRLLQSDSSEYHFVNPQGWEQMIPKSQIRTISRVPERAPGQSDRCPSSATPAPLPQ